MSVLLHISDTHFGTEQPAVVEALLRLAQDLAPDAVLWSGDITQRATVAQFAAARRFAARLPAPVLAVPGNHDLPLLNLPLRLLRPYARYCAAFGSELEPVLETSAARVALLTTTRLWRHTQGALAPAQVARAATWLAAGPAAQLRVVVAHHPAEVPLAAERRNRVRGHEAARRAWQAAGVDLVLGGHIHLPYVMALGADGDAPWGVQAGTAVSTRIRRGIPNSVNLIRYEAATAARRAVVERWDFAAGAFRCAASTALALRAREG